MYSLRLDGYSLQEIADKFGITKERVRQIIPNIKCACRRSRRCKYPRLYQYMIDNNLNHSDLGKLAMLSQSAVSSFLCGITDPRKKTIDKILEITGMTYEEAFSTSTNEK